jgi:hypothetical protein
LNGFRWRRYRGERLVLALVAVIALGPVYPVGFQDVSRLALTQSLVDSGTLRIDPFADQTGDSARYRRHYYTDKAPGISFFAVPTFALLRGADVLVPSARAKGAWSSWRALWVLRLLTGGIFFLVSAFLVGRLAEGLRPGFGARAVVAFGVATLAMPLAPTVFGHVAAGALGLGAFTLLLLGVQRRRWWLWTAGAGGCVGFAVLFEYQASLIGVVLLAYLLLRRRSVTAALAFAAGALPGLAALAVYDAKAFGSPLHLSYRYVTMPVFAEQQHKHLFGIGVPHPSIVRAILFDSQRGLLVTSPVLLAALFGLVLLWRRGARAEAAVCLVIAGGFFVLNAGYFDYWGGFPGPRFVGPALPFVALGFGAAFERWPRATTVLALVSIVGADHQALDFASGTSTWQLWAAGSTRWFLAVVPRAAAGSAMLVLSAAALLLAAGGYGLSTRRREKTIGAASASVANAKK